MFNVFRFACLYFLLSILFACGGGSSGGSNGSSSTSSSSSSGAAQPALAVESFVETANTWVVTIESNISWTIEAEDWINVSQTSGTGDQQVTVTVDYENAPAGEIDTNITVVAADNSGLQSTYRFHTTNGITISPLMIGLNKTWGAVSESEIQIYTFLDWTISTDLPGITFTPTSGSGSQAVQITYDQTLFEVGGDYNATVTVTSGEVVETAEITLSMNAPVPFYDHSEALLQFEKSTFENSMQQQLALIFRDQAIVPWEVRELPDWLQATATSGTTPEYDLFFSLTETPVADGIYKGSFEVFFDIPGAPLTWEIEVELEANGLKLHARDYALAHGNYGDDAEQSGTIHIGNYPQQGLVLQAQADQEWIVFGEQDGADIPYTLQTDALSVGFHRASISVNAVDNVSVTPANLQLGFYQATDFDYEANIGIATDQTPIAVDKLGPWLYLTQTASNDIQVFNVHNNAYEDPLALTESADISQRVFSDDGLHLFVNNRNTQTIEAWDLLTRTRVYETPALGSVENLRYLRASGLAVLYVDGKWLNAQTGVQLDLHEEVTASAELGATNLAISPIGHGFYGVTETCDVYVQELGFNAARSEILLEEASTRVYTACINAMLTAASHADNLFFNTFYTESFNRKLLVTELNLSTEAAISAVIGTEIFAAALAQSGELFLLARDIEEVSRRYYYQYYTTDFVPYLFSTIPEGIVPEPLLFVSADSTFTSYVYHSDSDRYIRTIYNSY